MIPFPACCTHSQPVFSSEPAVLHCTEAPCKRRLRQLLLLLSVRACCFLCWSRDLRCAALKQFLLLSPSCPLLQAGLWEPPGCPVPIGSSVSTPGPGPASCCPHNWDVSTGGWHQLHGAEALAGNQGPGAGSPQSRRPRLFLPELSCSCQPTSKEVRLQFQPHKTLSLPRYGLWSLHAAWALSYLFPR